MTLRSALFCSAAFVAFAAPAMAQVTADEVWQNQIGYLSSLGFVVNATAQRDGATVTMSDVTMVWAVPMGLGAVTIATPDITMTENGDGTVAIAYPDKFRMTLRADLTIEGETGTAGADLGVRLDGQSMVASGTAQAVTYNSQTALMDVLLDRIILEGGAGNPDDIPPVTLIVTVRDLLTDTTITDAGDTYTIATVSTTGQSIFEVGFEDGFGTTSTTVGAVDTSSTTSSLVVPKTPLDWLNLSTALRNGLSLETTTEAMGSRQQTVASMDGSIVSDQSQTADISSQTLALSAAGLALGGNTQGVQIAIAQDFMIPFPVQVSAQELSGNFSMPLLADTAPQNASFGIALRGVTAGDDLWGMFDPGAVLPRDPATLAFSMDADVISRVDMLDIMAWEGVAAQIDMGQIPADIVNLRMTGVEVAALGALLTGEGSFTFDNADRTTFPGFPRPEGTATARMTGLYGALDSLSQLGLLPMEVGVGARATIGLFARATGEDELTSAFAIGPDGAMTVNGAPFALP